MVFFGEGFWVGFFWIFYVGSLGLMLLIDGKRLVVFIYCFFWVFSYFLGVVLIV